jgi:hypothetical protein
MAEAEKLTPESAVSGVSFGVLAWTRSVDRAAVACAVLHIAHAGSAVANASR